MSVLVEKFYMAEGDAMRSKKGCEYGLVKQGPYTHPLYGTVAVIDSYYDDELLMVFPEEWTHASGCECGNPFTLCHPEA